MLEPPYLGWLWVMCVYICVYLGSPKERSQNVFNNLPLQFDSHPLTAQNMFLGSGQWTRKFIGGRMTLIESPVTTFRNKLSPEWDTLFNGGVNSGQTAGQTVLHWQVHLVPPVEPSADRPDKAATLSASSSSGTPQTLTSPASRMASVTSASRVD